MEWRFIFSLFFVFFFSIYYSHWFDVAVIRTPSLPHAERRSCHWTTEVVYLLLGYLSLMDLALTPFLCGNYWREMEVTVLTITDTLTVRRLIILFTNALRRKWTFYVWPIHEETFWCRASCQECYDGGDDVSFDGFWLRSQKTLSHESINRGLVYAHLHSIARTQKILTFMF